MFSIYKQPIDYNSTILLNEYFDDLEALIELRDNALEDMSGADDEALDKYIDKYAVGHALEDLNFVEKGVLMIGRIIKWIINFIKSIFGMGDSSNGSTSTGVPLKPTVSIDDDNFVDDVKYLINNTDDYNPKEIALQLPVTIDNMVGADVVQKINNYGKYFRKTNKVFSPVIRDISNLLVNKQPKKVADKLRKTPQRKMFKDLYDIIKQLKANDYEMYTVSISLEDEQSGEFRINPTIGKVNTTLPAMTSAQTISYLDSYISSEDMSYYMLTSSAADSLIELLEEYDGAAPELEEVQIIKVMTNIITIGKVYFDGITDFSLDIAKTARKLQPQGQS